MTQTDIQDIDCLIKMVTCMAEANEAMEKQDWEKAIELSKEFIEHFPTELETRKPGSRANMLETIANCYLLLDRPEEAEEYLAQSVRATLNSPDFKKTQEKLQPSFDRPLKDLPFDIEGLSKRDEPYSGLVVPDALPLLQHVVHILRPHGINVHAWMYEAAVTMGEELSETAHKMLPDYLPPSEIERFRRPRKYSPDEAVIMRGKDGCIYKLEAPGRLTKVNTIKKRRRKGR